MHSSQPVSRQPPASSSIPEPCIASNSHAQAPGSRLQHGAGCFNSNNNCRLGSKTCSDADAPQHVGCCGTLKAAAKHGTDSRSLCPAALLRVVSSIACCFLRQWTPTTSAATPLHYLPHWPVQPSQASPARPASNAYHHYYDSAVLSGQALVVTRHRGTCVYTHTCVCKVLAGTRWGFS